MTRRVRMWRVAPRTQLRKPPRSTTVGLRRSFGGRRAAPHPGPACPRPTFAEHLGDRVPAHRRERTHVSQHPVGWPVAVHPSARAPTDLGTVVRGPGPKKSPGSASGSGGQGDPEVVVQRRQKSVGEPPASAPISAVGRTVIASGTIRSTTFLRWTTRPIPPNRRLKTHASPGLFPVTGG